jgi:hypothetical protein
MTEKGYKDGLVSRVRNKHSGKRYVVSTAQEIGQDYWSTVIFPGIFLGFFPKISEAIFSFIRNNKNDAHVVHWQIKEMTKNELESEWFEKMPSPEPPGGFSDGAKKILGEE